jgi:hypothetical protein
VSEQHPIMAALSKAQYDLTSAQAWLAEVKRQVAALGIAPAVKHDCNDCGLALPSAYKLAEHRYLQHDGPTPEHWEQSEALAAPDDETGPA